MEKMRPVKPGPDVLETSLSDWKKAKRRSWALVVFTVALTPVVEVPVCGAAAASKGAEVSRPEYSYRRTSIYLLPAKVTVAVLAPPLMFLA